MRSLLSALTRCRRAGTAIEYGLIVSLIVIVMVVALKLLATQTVNTWDNVHAAVSNAR